MNLHTDFRGGLVSSELLASFILLGKISYVRLRNECRFMFGYIGSLAIGL